MGAIFGAFGGVTLGPFAGVALGPSAGVTSGLSWARRSAPQSLPSKPAGWGRGWATSRAIPSVRVNGPSPSESNSEIAPRPAAFSRARARSTSSAPLFSGLGPLPPPLARGAVPPAFGVLGAPPPPGPPAGRGRGAAPPNADQSRVGRAVHRADLRSISSALPRADSAGSGGGALRPRAGAPAAAVLAELERLLARLEAGELGGGAVPGACGPQLDDLVLYAHGVVMLAIPEELAPWSPELPGLARLRRFVEGMPALLERGGPAAKGEFERHVLAQLAAHELPHVASSGGLGCPRNLYVFLCPTRARCGFDPEDGVDSTR
ncbi:unnamed protein product, partial [Prorocentrum cordatum]